MPALEVGPDEPTIRVVCSKPGAFHDHYGRSILATYTPTGTGGAQPWMEVLGITTAYHRRKEWISSLTPEERDAVIHGRPDAPRSPFEGVLNPGTRPAATTYLRGDTPAGDDAHHIESALTRGARDTSRGSFPARPEDLAGRAQVELRCKCSPPPLRVRGERLWPIFDRLVELGETSIELSTLRRGLR